MSTSRTSENIIDHQMETFGLQNQSFIYFFRLVKITRLYRFYMSIEI